MDFVLDKKHELARQLFRDFSETEVKPLAIELDETHDFPAETVKKYKKYGFMGIPFAKELGGQGCDYLTYAIAVEEISKNCASSGGLLSAHTSLGAGIIHDFGNDEQKEKFLRPLIDGRYLGAFAITEPEAGTDAGGVKTTAILDGDHFVMNGNKIFITNAGYADVFTIIAMTDVSKGQRGLSAIIVPRDTPGFSVGKPEMKCGIHASSTCELVMEDAIVPKENLLGKENKGFVEAMHTLDGGRIGIAAQGLGIAEGALARTIEYVKQRKQFGRPLAKFQNTQFKIAEMITQVQAAQLLVYRAAVAHDTVKRFSVEAAEAKLAATTAATQVATECIQLMGGYGYMQDYEVERMYRDAKITEIYEGTSEVMKMVISGAALA